MEYSLSDLKAEQKKRQLSKIIDRCKEDPIYFINNFVRTVDPRGLNESVPFKLFSYQEDFVRTLHESLKESMTGNLTKKTVAVDKSRDMGATWCVVSFHTWAWLFLDGFNALWGGKVEEDIDDWTVGKIFGKAHFLIDRLPSFLQPENWNHGKNKDIRRKMKLTHPNGNFIKGESSSEFSRSGRYTSVFADEYAFWERDRESWTAMGSATRHKIIVSTPNGFGNVFYDLIHSNKTRIHIRLHWKIDPRFNEGLWFDETQQIWRSPWYDTEVEERLLGGSSSMKDIKQELDCDYRQSGDPAFPSYLLKRHIPKGHELEPQPYDSYGMGVDVSQGLEGTDLQSITILSKLTGFQVYQWTGKLSAIGLAKKIVEVAKSYNNCLVAIERNNGGQEIINRVKELSYYNLYYQKKYDRLSEVRTQSVGWWTGNNKPMMILDFQAALQMKQVKLTDKPTTDEFRKYQLKISEGNTKKYGAPKGHHDDRVMSTMIAWQCLKDVQKPLNQSQRHERDFKKKEKRKKRFISSVCGY